jgi:uncharacterized integral membrane protein
MTTTDEDLAPDGATAGQATTPSTDHAQGAAATATDIATGVETRAERLHRVAHSSRLHGYAIVTVALGAGVIALAASNTAHVRVDWLVGHSQVSLVWLVLLAAIFGWAIGLLTSARFHWLTRFQPNHRR